MGADEVTARRDGRAIQAEERKAEEEADGATYAYADVERKNKKPARGRLCCLRSMRLRA